MFSMITTLNVFALEDQTILEISISNCASGCDQWGFSYNCVTTKQVPYGACDLQSCARCKTPNLKSYKFYGANFSYRSCNNCGASIGMNCFYWYCSVCNTYGYCYNCTSQGLWKEGIEKRMLDTEGKLNLYPYPYSLYQYQIYPIDAGKLKV